MNMNMVPINFLSFSSTLFFFHIQENLFFSFLSGIVEYETAKHAYLVKPLEPNKGKEAMRWHYIIGLVCLL